MFQYFQDDHFSSSSSEDELFEVFPQRIKPKNENYLDETVQQYSESDFFEQFRVTKRVADNIAERYENSEYYFHQSGVHGKLTPYAYTIIFLWFAAHEAASYRDVSDRFGVAPSTLRKVVERIIYFLGNLSPEVITWPNPEEQFVIREHFRVNGFEGVVGVIDGSHVRIDKPSNDPDSYINRKGYYSMQFQIVCDHTTKIRDVMIGFPGSVHDSRVFQASPLSRTLREKCQDNYIIGDSGYPCVRNLLTPYKDLGNLSRRQQNYNIKLAKTRYVIEHCFGILKQKFRQLYHLKLRGDHDIANFIRACCVLHNLALGDEFLEYEEQDNVEIAENIQPDNIIDERDGAEMRNVIANNLPLD